MTLPFQPPEEDEPIEPSLLPGAQPFGQVPPSPTLPFPNRPASPFQQSQPPSQFFQPPRPMTFGLAPGPLQLPEPRQFPTYWNDWLTHRVESAGWRRIPYGQGFTYAPAGYVQSWAHPEYRPSYWENPRNVFHWFHKMKTGLALPEDMDPKALDQAYRYFEEVNYGSDPLNWRYLHPEDPGRQFLQGLAPPPLEMQSPQDHFPDVVPIKEMIWDTTFFRLAQKPVEQWDQNDITAVSALPAEMQWTLYNNQPQVGEARDLEELHPWQQWVIGALANPAQAGGLQMGGAALIMSGGNPLAGAFGYGLGYAGGAISDPNAAPFGFESNLRQGLGGLGFIPQVTGPTGIVARAMQAFDLPAEQLEKVMGIGLQVTASTLDPETYGSVQEIFRNLPAAWEAAALTATTGALTQGPLAAALEAPGVFQETFDEGGAGFFQLGAEASQRTLHDSFTGRMDVTNFLPTAWYVITSAKNFLKGEDLPAFPTLSGDHQVWLLDRKDPVTVDTVGVAALVAARREIMAGKDPAEVLRAYTEQFGYSGEFTELVDHIIADPLNVAPAVTGKAQGGIARILGNDAAAHAFSTTEGFPINIQGWKKYGTYIRENALRAGAADELTWFQRRLAGLNDTGRIARLDVDKSKYSPFRRAFSDFFDLAPDSKARMYLAMSTENVGAMFDQVRFAGEAGPDLALQRFTQATSLPPHKAAAISSELGSASMYTIRQGLASFTEKMGTAVETFHLGDEARGVLTNISRVLGEQPHEVIRMLRDTEGKNLEPLYNHIIETAKAGGDEVSQRLLAEAQAGNFTAENLQGMFDLFLGDANVPWHPLDWLARTQHALVEHLGTWAADKYGVAPDSSFWRFFQTMKAGQSLLLLGINPAYLANNAVNNVVTRAATGIFGFVGRATIDKFMDDFGIEPYRLEAGTGAAAVSPELVTKAAVEGLTPERPEPALGAQIGQAGETQIHQAKTTEGILADASRVLNEANNKIGIFANLSRRFEVAESRQAFYFGMRNTWGPLWRRGNGFRKMDFRLEQSLAEIDPRLPGAVYGLIESGMSRAKIEQALASAAPQFIVDEHLPGIARDLGLDHGIARQTLSPVIDELQSRLADAKTPDDVRRTFQELENIFQDNVDELNLRDLETRMEDIANRVASGGLQEAYAVFDKLPYKTAEWWGTDFTRWQETFAKAELMHEQGAGAQVKALFQQRFRDANRGWARIRKFERAGLQGMIEAIGLKGDETANRIILLTDQQQQLWQDFHATKQADLREFYNTIFDTREERIVAWDTMQERHLELYNETSSQWDRRQVDLDAAFVETTRQQFGPDAALRAGEWRQTVAQFNAERQRMMYAFQDSLRGQPAEVRRREWAVFLREDYLPFIYQYLNLDVEGRRNFWKGISGEDFDPPEGGPPTGPIPGEPPPSPAAPPSGPEAPLAPGGAEAAAPPPSGGAEADVISPPPPVEAPPPAPEPGAGLPPAVEAPAPAPPPEPTFADLSPQQRATELARIVEEHNARAVELGDRALPTATRAGAPLDAAILNAVRKYGIQNLDDITPELLQRALEARELRIQNDQAAIVRRQKVEAEQVRQAEIEAEQARQFEELDRKLEGLGGEEPPTPEQVRALQIEGVPYDSFTRMPSNDLMITPEARDLMQSNAGMMLAEIERAELRQGPRDTRGVLIETPEGDVLGQLGRGYPQWYSDNFGEGGRTPRLQQLSGNRAVIAALHDIIAGTERIVQTGARKGQPYVIYERLKALGLEHFATTLAEAEGRPLPLAETGINRPALVMEGIDAVLSDPNTNTLDPQVLADLRDLEQQAYLQYYELPEDVRLGLLDEDLKALTERLDKMEDLIFRPPRAAEGVPFRAPPTRVPDEIFDIQVRVFQEIEVQALQDRIKLDMRESAPYNGRFALTPDELRRRRQAGEPLTTPTRGEPLEIGPGQFVPEVTSLPATAYDFTQSAMFPEMIRQAINQGTDPIDRITQFLLDNYPDDQGVIADLEPLVKHHAPFYEIELEQTRSPAPPPPQPAGQQQLFPGAEDSPLFSGTAQTARPGDYVQRPVENQGIIPGFEGEVIPQMKGALEAEGPAPAALEGAAPETTLRMIPAVIDDLRGQRIVGAVQNAEGKIVAYIPSDIEITRSFDTSSGRGRLLGLHPEKADTWVYELNGEIKEFKEIRGASGRAQGLLPGLGVGPDQGIPADFREQGILQAAGPAPPDAIAQTMPAKYPSILEGDHWEQHTRPILSELEDRMVASGGASGIGGIDLPTDIRSGFDGYMGSVYNDLGAAKLATVRWAEQLRDQALLNYSRRYGFDRWLDLRNPYQFWYTRSAVQWALRAFQKPQWFANYARIRNHQRQVYERAGFPARLRDRFQIHAPYLEGWMGDNVWVDPFRKLFPLAEFLTPLERMQQDRSNQVRTAEFLLSRWASEGQIDRQEAVVAFRTREGPLWQRALAQASRDSQAEVQNPMDFIDIVMQPALYWTLPEQLLTGSYDESSPLPFTRTGQALRTVTKDTAFEAVGQVVGGLLAAPEEWFRRKQGVSQFGQWGEYYVDRMLSNMAGEGFDVDEIELAMTEKQGPLYDEAVRRVELEVALRTPGALPLYAGLRGAAWNNPGEFMSAIMWGWLPSGLLPEGELAQRGLAEKYKLARAEYNAGGVDAIERFFDENPEYRGRQALALWEEPEERLRQFLVSEIWDRYGELGSLQKQQVRQALGATFEDLFLNRETQQYDALDVQTLAYWAQQMGATVPETPETAPITSDPDISGIEFAPDNEAAIVNIYRQTRSQLFPNWFAMQTRYFDLPPGPQRQGFLVRFPELAEYWDWNKGYKAANPVIEKYQTDPADLPSNVFDYSFVEDFDPALVRQLIAYYYADQPLQPGANEALRRVWQQQGSVGGSFQNFVDQILAAAFAPTVP